MKHQMVILLGLFITTFACGQVSPQDMVVVMGRGINLGNTLSAPVEGNWQPAVEETYFEDVADVGFTTVRIPIDFFGYRTSGDTSVYSKDADTSSSYTGNLSDYVVDASYLDRLEEVITWSLEQGLITILDFHGGTLKSEFLYTHSPKTKWEAYYTHPTSAKRMADEEKFRAIWSAIANRFKDYSYNLLFEVVNEPYFFLTAIEMDLLNTDIISIIRTSGSNNTNRNILITGGSENSHEAPLQIGTDVLNSDSYLIASYHYYKPRDFTASSQEDHNDFNWGTDADKATIDSNFNEVYNWSLTNDIPILFGEFGADNEGGYDYYNATYGEFGGPENESRVAFHGYLAEKAIALGFAFTAWDAGEKSNKTIYKVTDRTWVEEVRDALLGINLDLISFQTDDNTNLTLYPNPASNQVNIQTTKSIETVNIVDVKGSEYKIEHINNNVFLKNLNDGLYLIKILFEDTTSITKKLLIHKHYYY